MACNNDNNNIIHSNDNIVYDNADNITSTDV